MGGPNVAVWTKFNRTGDAISPGSAELVVVGGMHVERDEESRIKW